MSNATRPVEEVPATRLRLRRWIVGTTALIIAVTAALGFVSWGSNDQIGFLRRLHPIETAHPNYNSRSGEWLMEHTFVFGPADAPAVLTALEHVLPARQGWEKWRDDDKGTRVTFDRGRAGADYMTQSYYDKYLIKDPDDPVVVVPKNGCVVFWLDDKPGWLDKFKLWLAER